jgi:hypothetical protein
MSRLSLMVCRLILRRWRSLWIARRLGRLRLVEGIMSSGLLRCCVRLLGDCRSRELWGRGLRRRVLLWRGWLRKMLRCRLVWSVLLTWLRRILSRCGLRGIALWIVMIGRILCYLRAMPVLWYRHLYRSWGLNHCMSRYSLCRRTHNMVL